VKSWPALTLHTLVEKKKRQLRCFESEIAINTKDTSLEKRPLGKNPFCVSAITILKTYRFNPQKN